MDETVKLESLKCKLKKIEKQIEEVEKRMPAHSVKPPIMREFFKLEDERDRIVKEISELSLRM